MKKLGLMLSLMAMVALVSAQDGKNTTKQVNKKAKTEKPSAKACAGGKDAACCANKGNTASCNSAATEKSCCSKGGTTTGTTGTGCQGHAATAAPAGDTKKQ